MLYLQLYYEFFKAGLFAIGGGMATLPFLYDISDKTGWYTYSQMADMIAVSESTPGAIGINMATYVGFTTGGAPGSVIATLGLVTPSIIIILIVARFLKAFKDNRYVNSAFYGLRPASTALIAAAGVSVLLLVLFGSTTLQGISLGDISISCIILMVILYFFSSVCKKTKGLHPVVFIALSAVIGVVFHLAGV
ncbi:MAG: chromate transporter [Clostridiales bacterium]|nr:chromate transporter [Clostridiales bacterium]